jgi:hypothetical protein
MRLKKYIRDVEKGQKENRWIKGNWVAEKISFSPFFDVDLIAATVTDVRVGGNTEPDGSRLPRMHFVISEITTVISGDFGKSMAIFGVSRKSNIFQQNFSLSDYHHDGWSCTPLVTILPAKEEFYVYG